MSITGPDLFVFNNNNNTNAKSYNRKINKFNTLPICWTKNLGTKIKMKIKKKKNSFTKI